MALSLGDVEKNHKKREETRVHGPASQGPTLRPWQGFDQRDDLRRVKKSELAISRAREIAKRNNEMAQRLREGFTSLEKSESLELELKQREKSFTLSREGQWGERVAIKRGFLSFFKDVFRPTQI